MHRLTRPVLLLAFANDHLVAGRYLRELAQERRGVVEALEEQEDRGRYEVVCLPDATHEDLVGRLLGPRYGDRVAIFHFAGHGGDSEIVLESEEGGPKPAFARGLAKLLGGRPTVQLVFLNGCATQGHCKLLRATGVPAVIVTDREIEDAVAREFAIRFYQGIGAGRTIKTSYEDAASTLMLRLGDCRRSAYQRSFLPASNRDLAWPWQLDASDGGGWCLFDANDRDFGLPEAPIAGSPRRALAVSRENLELAAPQWLSARDRTESLLEQSHSVNLVVSEGVAWRELVETIRASKLPDLAVVNLENGVTASRRGLIEEIVRAFGATITVEKEPRDLAALNRLFDGRPRRYLALTHLDLAQHRIDYNVDLFAALRYFITSDHRPLVLLAVSRQPFGELLPSDHPLSHLELQTVYLRGHDEIATR